MKHLLLITLLMALPSFAQESTYNETLAKSVGADEYGMKSYVFCILKTGSNTTATKEEKAALFKSHMDNINRLSKEGKLVVAGPFGKNDRNYRGVFILNAATLEEAKALVATDPAVKANIFEAELTPWYASAALMKVGEIHETIVKTKL